MRRYPVIIATLAMSALTAGCGKGGTAETGNEAVNVAVAADPSAPAANAVTPVATAAAGCPLKPEHATAWRAEVDEKPPVPEGGRPLYFEGKVELVQDGQMAILTPGALEGGNQHFTLEIKPDPEGRASVYTVSTSVYPVPKATMAVVECGGATLGRVSIEHKN